MKGRIKAALCCLIAALLSLQCAAAAQGGGEKFSDVKDGSWYAGPNGRFPGRNLSL